MKLVRFHTGHAIHLGAVRGDLIVDLTADGIPYPEMLDLVADHQNGLAHAAEIAARGKTTTALASAKLLAPIARPGKYLAIGMNYQSHVEESARIGVAAPTQQLWFNKQTTCVSGPFDEIQPGVTLKLDYEVELGVVIGTTAKNVSAATAFDHIFGYFVANDVSARDWQFHSPTFTMGKSFDTHGPIGPWIVTADEVSNPQALDLLCRVNGEIRQSSNTAHMIHNIAAQIAYLSTAFTLEPGDLIATGTPEGVGIGMEPPRFLKAGDVVRCEIEAIGAIENRVAVA